MSQIILDSANDLIQGDFDNATLSQRTRLQTSTVNATTGVYVVPNGTANSASVQISNAADPTNASKVVVATNASIDTQIVSGANGSGTYLPLSFYTNNDIRFQIGNAGQLGVRTAPGTVSSGTSGQFLTSGGPGAGVSWTTVTVPPSGQLQTEIFTSPGTWSKPASCTQVKVTIVGGGGGGAQGLSGGGGAGGHGGYAVVGNIPVSGPVSVTVGSGGIGGPSPSTVGTGGGTSSFGSAVSCTGGGGGPTSPATFGTAGSATISSGTTLNIQPIQQNTGSRSAGTFPSSGDINIGLSATALKRTQGTTTAIAWSAPSRFVAGTGGVDGAAPTPGTGGVGGVVIVEFVG